MSEEWKITEDFIEAGLCVKCFLSATLKFSHWSCELLGMVPFCRWGKESSERFKTSYRFAYSLNSGGGVWNYSFLVQKRMSRQQWLSCEWKKKYVYCSRATFYQFLLFWIFALKNKNTHLEDLPQTALLYSTSVPSSVVRMAVPWGQNHIACLTLNNFRGKNRCKSSV